MLKLYLKFKVKISWFIVSFFPIKYGFKFKISGFRLGNPIFALAPFTFECAKSACPSRYVTFRADFPRFLPKGYACGTPLYAYRCFETWFLGVSKSTLHVWSFQERYLCPQGPLFWPPFSVLFAWKCHFFPACSEHVSRWKTAEMVL